MADKNCKYQEKCEQSEKQVRFCMHCNNFKNFESEVWINIYGQNGAFWTSGMFYKTSKQARTKICDRKNYYCTINVTTGERITKPLRKEQK